MSAGPVFDDAAVVNYTGELLLVLRANVFLSPSADVL